MRERDKGLVLVVDDEPSVRDALAQILADEGYRTLTAASGEEGVAMAAEQQPDAVFLDVWLPGMDGIEALQLLRERGVDAPVIMISGHGTIETAVKATKLGAYDFIEKPVALERVLLVTSNALRQARLERRNRALRAQLRREAEFIGSSAAVERLRAELSGAVDGAPVLLYGEKGTGRRLAARWLALHGPKADGPFLDVQVSALPRERLIRALFGEPGSGSRAVGRIAHADEGTLYLENGDTLPPAVQSSLAAGLRTGLFPVPGSRRSVRSEPLVILSLLEPPEGLVERGGLSGELLALFRHTIEIPPLRRRIDDLPALAERFLHELCNEYAREPLSLSEEALAKLLEYDWPGNVRELKRVIERLVLLAPGPQIGVADLPAVVVRGRAGREAEDRALLEVERRWTARQLEEADGSVAKAAERLGIDEETFRRRLRRLGLEPDG
ncbi:MAG: sigma-54-dependent Fis family transcriptional regulator [Acidobacteria bacterium]|nr:MAG: sigma-54-dependent Fis family transcriptional regulator [Acidobacteriota bacterium]